MTTINTGIPLDQAGVKAIDMSKVKRVEFSEEQKARIEEIIASAPDPKFAYIAELFSAEQLQRNEQARTAYNAQAIAQDQSTESSASASAEQTTEEKFLEFMELTPEERYFDMFLKERGMTQEEFDALPPEQQEKIAEEIRQEIREKVEQDALPA